MYTGKHLNFIKGDKQVRTGGILTGIGVGLTGFLLVIPGLIVYNIGSNNKTSAFTDYYRTCVNPEVCAKYGIIITPYNTSLTFK